jgi:hypothetical protein
MPSNFAHHEPNSKVKELFALTVAPYIMKRIEKRKLGMAMRLLIY